ncbi:MAG: heavy metal translocating P-type ATPase [Phycisphaeraceae bacterium]|nr:heavy metal translocating P-type ATPase [Phycisphaeraceae bacterium]
MTSDRRSRIARVLLSRNGAIASLALLAIAVHAAMRLGELQGANIPLFVALIAGGVPLVVELLIHVVRLEFGSDLLAGISIVTAAVLGEYLAGTLVVLMLSGGGALEAYAVRNASSVLDALARRMPTIAHRQTEQGVRDVPLDDISVGDTLVILPHEVCPADGTVVEGHSSMDESYLTGEPFVMSKTPGAAVISGAINGESALTIRADRAPVDSRYAKIMAVMHASQQHRPRMRRMADRLGAWYTPAAVALALAAWLASGDPTRFLAVLVVATPCPLLIAIPVSIIGSISLAARRSIVIRDPVVLERVSGCRTMILDKTGTLTYGRPQLTDRECVQDIDGDRLFALVASVERFSKHPLAKAILARASDEGVRLLEVRQIAEPPGQGLRGQVDGRSLEITSRRRAAQADPISPLAHSEDPGGLECAILADGKYVALYRFRDVPRTESRSFIEHLSERHGIRRVMLVSGDRESEVRYLAEQVGISNVHAGQSPEQKVELVKRENLEGSTVFVGDGINDAPALLTATVGIALGTSSDVTIEAAGAVILDSSLERVDELLHIGARMRRIAMQSAVGGMGLSVIAMLLAAAGYLPPVAGAITQEVIDVFAVVNALRVALRPGRLSDFDPPAQTR